MPTNQFRRFITSLSAIIISGSISFNSHPAVAVQQEDSPLWQDVNESGNSPDFERTVTPESYSLLGLDVPQMAQLLAGAPLEIVGDASVWDAAVTVSLPLPDGGFEDFRLVESPVMEPELAARYPQIRTYLGTGVTTPSASVRLDLTPHGFHAMLFMPDGTVFIDPFLKEDPGIYASYYTRDYARPAGELPPFESGPLVVPGGAAKDLSPAESLDSGNELRTYRLAVGATGEYTQFHGGTVADGLAAVVTAVNRVTGVYELEVAVRMILVANNDLIIYTNGATDPYTNNNGGAMLGQNQTTLDGVIGSANYDVGHVFSTGGGGVAYLGVPCQAGFKAGGVTGLANPTGDPFYIDYVAHEMGHQFGANHTFNGNAGSCAGGNRNASTAYEPGSGTTIMAYAGICGDQDIQPNSDDVFHTISWEEIIEYTTEGAGDACAVVTATGNQAPLVEAGAGGFTIPKNTPFTLAGTGSDPGGGDVTFSWEEFDLGPAGHPNSPSGNAPIFRSFPPVSSPFRTFPQISDIVDNIQTIGELLPGYARTLTFRLTARDNQVAPGAGGVAFDTIQFSVSGTAGPFLVTEPNTAVTWEGGTPQDITWDVAGTASAPVNCLAVDLSLSTDGGLTYPTVLLEDTPNDGSASVMAPQISTGQARVQVMCATGIFFDISNTNFTIEPGEVATLAIDKTVAADPTLIPGSMLTYTITVDNVGLLPATATVTDDFSTGLVDPSCNGVPGDLSDVVNIDPTDQSVYTCDAQVDPDLRVDLTLLSGSDSVPPGSIVDFTVTASNPDPVLTLTDVTLAPVDLPGCPADIGDPFTLAPGGEKQFICSTVMPGIPLTSLVSVTALVALSNTASASAPEDPQGSIMSPTVNNEVALEGDAEITVNPYLPIYLPLSFNN